MTETTTQKQELSLQVTPLREPTECELILGPLCETVWGERILRGEREDLVLAPGSEAWPTEYREAVDWVTCACGRAGDVPRGKNGVPLDLTLCALGCDFPDSFPRENSTASYPYGPTALALGIEPHTSAVGHWANAARILVAIERRATEAMYETREGVA